MTNETIDGFTGIWIPKEIWFDEKLRVMEKFFYSEVTGLSGTKGCFASNAHFIKVLRISSARVSQLVKSLTDKNYITVKLFFKKGTKQVTRREIYPIKSYPVQKRKTEFTLEELEKIDTVKRDFKGVWIPKELLFEPGINKLQMAMITEISSLSVDDIGCFASNKHFAEFLNVSSPRASQLITDLESKKYVKTKKFSNPDNSKQIIRREIYLLRKFNGVLNKFNEPTKKIKSPYLENYKEREPSLDNHLDNNTVGEPDGVIPYQSIIDYLNTKTEKTFRPSTPKSRKFITERWNEGFRLDDFKKVVDNKVINWLNDPTKNVYLRPQTLFGPNFESYLNEKSDIPLSKRTGRQPIIEVGTDWSAPENQARITDKNKYEKSMEKLAAVRARLDAE